MTEKAPDYLDPTYPEDYDEIREARPIPLQPGEYIEGAPAAYVPAESNIARTPDARLDEEHETAEILAEMKDLYINSDQYQHMEFTPGHDAIPMHLYGDPRVNPAGLKPGDRFRKVYTKKRSDLNDKLADHAFSGDTTAILSGLRDIVGVTREVNNQEQAKWQASRKKAEQMTLDARKAGYAVDEIHSDLHDVSRTHTNEWVRQAASDDMDNALQDWSEDDYWAKRAKADAVREAPPVHGYGSEQALDATISPYDRYPAKDTENYNVLSKMEAEHNTRVENVRTAHEAIQVSINFLGRPDHINSDPVATQAAIEDVFIGKAIFDQALGELSEHDSTRAELWMEGNKDTFRILHRVIVNRQMYDKPSDDPLYYKYPAHFNEDGSIRFNAGTGAVTDIYPDGTAAFPEELTEEDGITPYLDPDTGEKVIEMVRVNGEGEIVTTPAVEVLDFKRDAKDKVLNDAELDALYQQWEVSRENNDAALLNSELGRHIGDGQKREKSLVDDLAKQEKRYQAINQQLSGLRAKGATAKDHPQRARYDQLIAERRKVNETMNDPHSGIQVRLESLRQILNPKIAKVEFLRAGSERKDAPALLPEGTTQRRMTINGIEDVWFVYPDGKSARPAPSRPGLFEYRDVDGVVVAVA